MAKQNSVIIDPGHGGSDPGAVYGNRREKDDTLALSYDIGNALERRGVRVEYTRVGDVYNSPYEKAQIGNSSTADLFLSIHRNAMAVPGAASGTLSLIFGRGGDAETFAENINKKLAAVGWNDLVSGRILWSSGIQHFRRFLWKLDLSTMRRTMTSSMRT